MNIWDFFGSAGFAAIISGGVSSLIWFLSARRDSIKDKDEIRAALRVLLEMEIKNAGREYIRRGSITLDELDEMERMNAVYHESLNGNGFIKSVMQQCENLPKKAA